MTEKKSGADVSKPTAGWHDIEGGVTAPQGYLASGVAAGIKKKGLDLAVLFSSRPTASAGVFTLNRVQAAPVLLSRENLKSARGRVRAVLINSGCANACTGERGMKDARLSARSLASHLNLEPVEVLVASTGVIGGFLPMAKMLKGISGAVSALNSMGGSAAAQAIMTTDTVEKSCAIEGRIGGKTVRIGGMAKGSGMIHPNMATMIAVITTDLWIAPRELGRCLRRVVDRTFNCLTVDGDTSTNDTVLVLANGASEAAAADGRTLAFRKRAARGLETLARASPGTARSDSSWRSKSGRRISSPRGRLKTIAHSPLVKTALYGQELNWGTSWRRLGPAATPSIPTGPAPPQRDPHLRNGSPLLRRGAGPKRR